MTNEALRAAVLAKRQGLNVRVINMPTIKPIDEEIILTAARECGRIITVEEHSIIGGLGEAVCSVVSEKLPVPVRRIGVMDQFGHSGPANEVLRDYGLTADNIVNVIRDIVRRTRRPDFHYKYNSPERQLPSRAVFVGANIVRPSTLPRRALSGSMRASTPTP